MFPNRFTELVGCRWPIQQAPMGRVSGAELTSAVVEAGGFGMLSVEAWSRDELAASLSNMQQIARGVYGVNFLVPFLNDVVLVDIAAEHARVVDFFYGDPDPALVKRVHRRGALASWQVGSRTEAVMAAEAGCDFVVAQGIEAGGHIRGRLPLLRLLSEVLEAVTIPVVAAGGIGTGQAMASALAAGAAAIRMGTRFVATEESAAHLLYKQALVAASTEDSVITDLFSLRWPNAPHRVLRSCIRAASLFQGEVVGEIVDGGARIPIPRLAGTEPTRTVTGAVDAMAQYAGESVGAVRSIQSARAIIDEVMAEATAAVDARRSGELEL